MIKSCGWILVASLVMLTAVQAQEPAQSTAAKSSASPATKAGKKPAAKKPVDAAAKVDPANPSASDKMTLDTTLVTGNRELPKVLYIVPWKKAELGQLPGQPFNSLLEEALTPVDREVFQRQVQYYGVIAAKDQPEAHAPGDSGGK